MYPTRKQIPLGKANILRHWGHPNNRKLHAVDAILHLERDTAGTFRPIVSISFLDDEGTILFTSHNMNELSSIPELAAQPMFTYLKIIMNEYALGIQAGNPEQTAAIRKGFALGKLKSIDPTVAGDAHKKYLQSLGLLNIQLPDGSWYRYGSGWANGKPVPGSHQAILKTLMGWI